MRETTVGVSLERAGGSDVIHSFGSREWSGADLGDGLLGAATDFLLRLAEGDEVVINWTEIRMN